MTDDPTCRICGHGGTRQLYADPPICKSCPDLRCENGTDGERYRAESSWPEALTDSDRAWLRSQSRLTS